MAAVLRVKRRLEDEPLEALILNCKRRKLSEDKKEHEGESELSSTVLKFAGTIKESENVLTHLKNQPVTDIQELKSKFKKHGVNISEKLRAEHLEHSKSNRYKIVNCFRSPSLEPQENSDSCLDKSDLTILDIEPVLNDNATDKEEISAAYVYDLYYTNSDDLGEAELEDYSVHPLNDPLLFGKERSGPNDKDSDDDSEDSNAENNWRNDYPDEDDMESINETDMVEAMKNVELDDDLLSSDEGEEGFVYSIDSEAAGFEEDIDESDVHRYGERYARFKAKHKESVETSGLEHDFYCGDIDEDEFYY